MRNSEGNELLNQRFQFILQAYATVCLIAEIQNHWDSFIESDFFKKLNGDDDILNMFKPLKDKRMPNQETISIGNTGSFPMFLYSLLVLPQESIKAFPENQKFKKAKEYLEEKYDEIDEILSDDDFLKDNTCSNYQNKDCKKTKNGNQKYDFIYHIRNSVSHGTLELNNNPNECWQFCFKDRSDNTSSRKIKEIKRIIELMSPNDKDQIVIKLDEIKQLIKASEIKEKSASFSSKLTPKNISFLVQQLVTVNKKFISLMYYATSNIE